MLKFFTMLLGVQVSISGKIFEAIEEAKILGCQTIQFFSRNPRKWRKGKLEQPDIEEFKLRRKQLQIGPIFVHIPYLSNLASPFRSLYRGSIKSYIEDIKEADSLQAEYIVTHMGSHKKTGEERGIKRIAEALNIILDKTKDTNISILLENTSGSGSWLGYKFQHQREIIERLEDKSRIGLCLDTCHAFCAGYELTTQQGLEATLTEIEQLIGLERLKLLHLNDSRDRCGSRRDRHQHIGKGFIGKEAFRRIVNHPSLKDLPMILETPKTSYEDDLMNLETIKSLFMPM